MADALQRATSLRWDPEREAVAARYELRLGALVLQQRRMEDAALEPGGERDSFTGRNLSFTFERDRNGQVIGFYVSNGRTRDVRFGRVRPLRASLR
jgi:hypothetical protein